MLGHINIYDIYIIYYNTAVSQYYEVDVNKEPVIKGNSVVMKCGIPSFVADYVTVLSWSTDKGDNFYPGIDYGIYGSYHVTCDGLQNVSLLIFIEILLKSFRNFKRN